MYNNYIKVVKQVLFSGVFVKRHKKQCLKCSRLIALPVFKRHENSCLTQKRPLSLKGKYLRVDKTCYCLKCPKIYANISAFVSHFWRMHTVDGRKFIPINGINKEPWNKGLKKETDERLKRNGETYSKNYKDGKFKLGQKHSLETREKLSKKIQEKVENGTWHLSFSKSKTYLYNGIKLHGTWEVAYATYLDKNNIKWIRPKETFPYIYKDRTRQYTPDFFLVEEQTYIEIKGYETERDRAKWKVFPEKLKIIKGKELFELGLIKSFKDVVK